MICIMFNSIMLGFQQPGRTRTFPVRERWLLERLPAPCGCPRLKASAVIYALKRGKVAMCVRFTNQSRSPFLLHPDKVLDLAEVVACKLLDHLAIFDQQDCRHVAGGVLRRLDLVKVADGELCLAAVLRASKCFGKLARVASASPNSRQIHHSLAALGKQRLEVRCVSDVCNRAGLHLFHFSNGLLGLTTAAQVHGRERSHRHHAADDHDRHLRRRGAIEVAVNEGVLLVSNDQIRYTAEGMERATGRARQGLSVCLELLHDRAGRL